MVMVIDCVTWLVLVPMLVAAEQDPARKSYWLDVYHNFESYNVGGPLLPLSLTLPARPPRCAHPAAATAAHSPPQMTLIIDCLTWLVLVPMLMSGPDTALKAFWHKRMFCFESYNVRAGLHGACGMGPLLRLPLLLRPHMLPPAHLASMACAHPLPCGPWLPPTGLPRLPCLLCAATRLQCCDDAWRAVAESHPRWGLYRSHARYAQPSAASPA
jgi:hypothetical protein